MRNYTNEELANHALNYIYARTEEDVTGSHLPIDTILAYAFEYFKVVGIDVEEGVLELIATELLNKYNVNVAIVNNKIPYVALPLIITDIIEIKCNSSGDYVVIEQRDIQEGDFYFYNPNHRKDTIDEILDDIEKNEKIK